MVDSIGTSDPDSSDGWLASAYYAEALVSSGLQNAWETMLDTLAWNPGLVGATKTRICGEPNCEGEVLQMKLVNSIGTPQPPFYARTIKAVPCRRIAWYCYPKLDDAFRIFLEFGLVETSPGVKFSIHWYALDRISMDTLAEHRKATDTMVQSLAVAFKVYCESQSERSKRI